MNVPDDTTTTTTTNQRSIAPRPTTACTMHESLEHKHPASPPMGAKAGTIVQTWFCCHCGITGQVTFLSQRAARRFGNDMTMGEHPVNGHGPMLTVIMQDDKKTIHSL